MELAKGIWQDLLLATRSLAKSRAFTLVCVLSLGIGMAPVIAIQYGVRIFTTPPPGLDVEGLVEVVTQRDGPREASDLWSHPNFRDLAAPQTGMALTGWAPGQAKVTLPDGAEVASDVLFVSPNYFDVMKKSLVRGPGFAESSEPVVILAFEFWQRRFGGDAQIIGRPIELNGRPLLVAGIAPEHFTGHLPHQGADLFIPIDQHPSMRDPATRLDRGAAWVRVHGRLSPGVAIEQGHAAIAAMTLRLAREYPATNGHIVGRVLPYHPIGNVEGQDLGLVVAVVQSLALIPLLVVCLNVSGMVQVRSAMRERELTIRQAIGASRRRLVQHLLAESIVLAAAGGALAAFVLFNLPALVSWFMGEPIPLHMKEALRVDGSMLAICAGVCLITSLVCGWLPAIRFSRPAIMSVLKDDTGTGGIRAGRVHRVTSALQIAIAVPLLVLSAVSLERVRATAMTDLGFEAASLYAAPIEGTGNPGVDPAFRIREAIANVSQSDGIVSATVADGLPLDFRYRLARVSSETEVAAAPTSLLAHVTRVGDNYLETLGLRLLAGRRFTTGDIAGSTPVTMVSKALADKLYPGADVIGRRIIFQSAGDKDRAPVPLTIVGVLADFPTSQMSTDREQLLLPLAQHADVVKDSVLVFDDRSNAPVLMLVARSRPGEPEGRSIAALENALRLKTSRFDRSTVVTGNALRQQSMDDFLNQSSVAAISGGLALLLAALGIYGVIGLMVMTRTREIAVRMTLGASRLRVIGLILFDVIKLVAPGVAAGLLIALALTRLNMGIALSTIEPLAYVAGAVISFGTAVLSALGPARRAASVQPMVAMRST